MATTLPGAPEAEAAAREGHDESDTQRRQRLRIVIAASLLGTTVEWYDFFLYATAAGLVFSKVFFPDLPVPWSARCWRSRHSPSDSSCGPIGGLVFGHIGDRIGRKRSLALTMLIRVWRRR